MNGPEVIWSFLVATLLGFLIGLERERKRVARGSIFAGVRTFPLVALFGAVAAVLSDATLPWLLPAALLPLTVLLGLAYWRESSGEKVGGTTEVAALVTFGLGAMAGFGAYVGALAGAVIVTGVLSLRDELRHLTRALTREDLFAVVQFAAVSLVVLPLLPDRAYGPWEVWNPRTIWLLVVLISGVSFVGYVASKLVGTRRGVGFTGLLGGLASSTAVTLAFSRRSRLQPDLGRVLAIGVLGATAVAAPRLVVLIAALEPELIVPALVPLGALFAVSSGVALLLYRRGAGEGPEVAISNPFELRSALQFGVLFALVLLAARAAEAWLGSGGVYAVSALAGITQLDAITLSLARQVGSGLDPQVATRGLALALAANSLFKAALAMALGGRRFGRAMLLALLPVAAACVVAGWLL